jgi:hypothetical protein
VAQGVDDDPDTAWKMKCQVKEEFNHENFFTRDVRPTGCQLGWQYVERSSFITISLVREQEQTDIDKMWYIPMIVNS